MPTELKPCPFCGGEASLVKQVTRNGISTNYFLSHYVQCDVCSSRGRVYNDKIENLRRGAGKE